MITYIIKTILCSASLFLIYYLLLEREKMYRFNRFYLLFGLLFPFMVAFITIKVAAPIMPVQETMVLTGNSLPASHTTPIYAPTESTNYLPYLLLAFYFIVSGFLLYRFIRNLKRLISKINGRSSIVHSGARLILTNDNAIPYSFLNYIFINRDKYEKGTIEKEVLQHELTHVHQMHSLDIILVELVIAFAWFNPLLFLFRKAILLNHEFLADESVIETFNDTESYQLLLLEKANRKNNLILSSSFNYLITKKRLIMMTRKTSQKVAIVKQIAIIPLIAAIGFLFSTKVVAQENTELLKQKQTEYSKQDTLQKNNSGKGQEPKSILENKLKLEKELQSKSYDDQKIKLDKEQKAKLDGQQVKSLDQQKVELDKALKTKLDDEQTMMNKKQAEMELQRTKMSKNQKSKFDKEQVKMNKKQAEMELQQAKIDQKVKLYKEQAMMNKKQAEMESKKVKIEKKQEAKMDEKQAKMYKRQAEMELDKAKIEKDIETKVKEEKAKQEQENK